MLYTHIFNSAHKALVTTVLLVTFGVLSFFMLEPSLSHSASVGPEEFIVTQTISDEVSFLIVPADVSMNGSIQGITGGYATGTTVAVVTTNDPQGYNMTLHFSSSTAMRLNTDPANYFINNYTPNTATVPDFQWVDNNTGGAAEFGYTVRASTTGEVDPSFRYTGSTCNTGSTEADNRCWLNPSTTPETIINTSASVAYSTTTIKFKVAVPNNPSPILPSGVYTATGTLTIAGNP